MYLNIKLYLKKYNSVDKTFQQAKAHQIEFQITELTLYTAIYRFLKPVPVMRNRKKCGLYYPF